MNGGRLSDDEAFFLGIRQFREELGGSRQVGDLQRSLRMIAVRYPEEADEMQELLEEAGEPLPGSVEEELSRILARVERQYHEDFAE